jgi:multimeric flavodoxin WrbA
MQVKIVGLSASLRNARRGGGNRSLVAELSALPTREALFTYLKDQASIHLTNFVEAGRSQKLPFDVLYKNLKKLKGDRGLSNSEIALAAALWSARQLGCDVEHIALSEHFPEHGRLENADALRSALLAADGLLLSTPVYFGDRGSLAQSFLDFLRNDPALRDGLRGKVYGGIAVGAKRNGGQETTLIYQLLDMVNCGMLGVGNDSETTSQYGGTGWAGDIGTMPADHYGLDTSMGTGRRVARVAAMLRMAEGHRLADLPRVAFWVLQDREDRAVRFLKGLAAGGQLPLQADILPIADSHVVRCLACDVCPTHIDVDQSYRCIIKTQRDLFPHLHARLLEADAIVPVAYSAHGRDGLQSKYQEFIERTRYLRRGDYVFSDLICSPLVIEELGASENMQVRMMTSMIRHHTVIMKPMTAYVQEDQVLNRDQVVAELQAVARETARASAGRLVTHSSQVQHLKYNPVGYVLSAMKDAEDEKMKARREMIEERVERSAGAARKRLQVIEPAQPLPEPKKRSA